MADELQQLIIAAIMKDLLQEQPLQEQGNLIVEEAKAIAAALRSRFCILEHLFTYGEMRSPKCLHCGQPKPELPEQPRFKCPHGTFYESEEVARLNCCLMDGYEPLSIPDDEY